jgi:hypothetical protein
METIHFMDFSFSIRQHLIAYGGASLGKAESQAAAIKAEMADLRNF